MAQGSLFIVSSPSGGGKTSLVRRLAEEMNDITVSVSYTTRAMRPGETDEVDYYFVDDKKFQALKSADAFLEDAHVFGHHYATSRTRVLQQLNLGFDVVLPIDWQGYHNVKAKMPEVIGIFIMPPSLSILKARLQSRAQDDEAIIAARMAQAKTEILHCSAYHYLIINDDFNVAFNDLQTIVRAERLRLTRQQSKHALFLKSLQSDA